MVKGSSEDPTSINLPSGLNPFNASADAYGTAQQSEYELINNITPVSLYENFQSYLAFEQ